MRAGGQVPKRLVVITGSDAVIQGRLQRAAYEDAAPRAGLTREEVFGPPPDPARTLRNWEPGRAEPDRPARACFEAITGDPGADQRALTHGHYEQR